MVHKTIMNVVNITLAITILVHHTTTTCALQIPQRLSAGGISSSPTNHCTYSSNQYHHRRDRHGQYMIIPSSPLIRQPTLLFSSNTPQLEEPNGSSKSPNNNNNNKSPQKLTQRIKRAILSFINLIITFPSKFKAYYSRLTKKGKIILSIQLLALGLVMGMGINSANVATNRAANRPVEVGYSTFLDLVDVNGKGHTPGKNSALKLSNVVISKDRVGFKVATDTEKHAEALLDKKLVKANDVSVRPIPSSQKSIYAMKPLATQDLIDTLREHEVPFRAASMKASNNLANIARFSIFAVYLLFLRKMYQTMGGGGQGQNSGGPGKLATFNAGEPIATFDDIEGIDGAKFEVMELVDTLRNPQKYEILGARAPTGLLLEGPPGTGEYLLSFDLACFF